MYRLIAVFVRRFPWPVVLFWILFAVGAYCLSPLKEKVAKDGEFAFLPENVSSRRAEELFKKAFPSEPIADPEIEAEEATEDAKKREEDQADRRAYEAARSPLGSSIAIILRHQAEDHVIDEEDRAFLKNVLLPSLKRIQRCTKPLKRDDSNWDEVPPDQRITQAIITELQDKYKPLLRSKDDRATLVVMKLRTEFLDRRNFLTIIRLEALLKDDAFKAQIPPGLHVDLTGSTLVGRDMLRAESNSASRTELFTKLLVIVLLLLIYRAPLLALIPLATVGLTVDLTVWLLRILAGYKIVGLFSGIDTYVTVVVYGAGVDYCLFLIARYKEELDKGASFDDALSLSIQKVGAALAASAGTSIFGIFMMSFADFGKFREAGVAISFGLLIVLICCLTFTPAMLRLTRQWAFWPKIPQEKLATSWMPNNDLLSVMSDQRWFERGWTWMAGCLERHPGRIFIWTLMGMMPFVVLAVRTHDQLSYGLLSDLAASEPSVIGTKVLDKHYAAGTTGVTTILIYHDQFDFSSLSAGRKFSDGVTQSLRSEPKGLGIDDIRTQRFPLGTTAAAEEFWSSLKGPELRIGNNSARDMYVSRADNLVGKVVRIDLVFNRDPFSRESIAQLTEGENAVRRAVFKTLAQFEEEAAEPSAAALAAAEEKYKDLSVLSIGPTAGIRDLKKTTDSDQVRIDLLVCLVVYAVIVVLLRQPAICAFLIFSVVYSYLVTIGVTVIVFWAIDPQGFAGLDWKVPIYLFTILIAMGEDYNILLMARVTEEQAQHGYVKGILTALTKTGSIISTCGVIMAGTFASLMSSTLLGMVEMGFALGFGVLLDTFIVRPILVPSYLILLYDGRFGPFTWFLGGPSAQQRHEQAVLLANSPTPPPA